MLGINAARALRRKIKVINITNPIEIIKVISTSCNELRTIWLRSIITSISTPAGNSGFNLGISALIASVVSTRLAPGMPLIINTTPGLPLTLPELLNSCTESFISATSFSRIGAAFRQAMMRSE